MIILFVALPTKAPICVELVPLEENSPLIIKSEMLAFVMLPKSPRPLVAFVSAKSESTVIFDIVCPSPKNTPLNGCDDVPIGVQMAPSKSISFASTYVAVE